MLLGLQLSGDEIVVKHLLPLFIHSKNTIIGGLVSTGNRLPPAVIEQSSMRNVAA